MKATESSHAARSVAQTPSAEVDALSGRFMIVAIRGWYGTLSRPSTLALWHPCHGDDVMDRNNRVGRRERFEILKIAQGVGKGVVAVDKGPLRPLRPNTILGALEESIARRNREGRIWAAFVDQFWIGRRVDDPQPSRSPKMRHDESRRT